VTITVRPIEAHEWEWLLEASRAMGGPKMLASGFLHDLADYPALVAVDGEIRCGFIVYRLGNTGCQILGILSTEPRRGVGSEMLTAVETMAKAEGKTRITLSATNDNSPAHRFLQLRGYTMRQLIPGAFLEVKRLKGLPADEPVLGVHGIEIRDEILFIKSI